MAGKNSSGRGTHRANAPRIHGLGQMGTVVGLVIGVAIAGIAGVIPTAAGAVQARSYLSALHDAHPPSGARQLCQAYGWACAGGGRPDKISTGDLAAIEQINRMINRSVRFVPDRTQHGASERWSLPTARGGDCEDIVLLKKRELIRRGYPAQSLLIATALDRQRRGHAVLILRTDRGDLVLDNLTDRIRNWSETGYIFLRMQNPDAPGRWVMVTSGS